MRKLLIVTLTFVAVMSLTLSACSGKGEAVNVDELEELSSSSEVSSSSINDVDQNGSSSSKQSSVDEPPNDKKLPTVYGSTETVWPLLNPDIEYGELVDERDGKIYKTVQIGTQTWMAQNLAFDPGLKDGDGQRIKFCRQWSRCDTIGFEYPWNVAVDTMCLYGTASRHFGAKSNCSNFQHHIRGICPEGWHMPSTDELNVLVDFVGGKDVAGAHLKAKVYWREHAEAPSNEFDTYGFAIQPTDKYKDFAHISAFDGDHSSRRALEVSSFWDEARVSDEGLNKDRSIRCVKDVKKIPYSSEPVAACNENGENLCEYGELLDVRDGEKYKTVVIGEQTWMAENLRYNSNYLDKVSGDSVETSWCHSKKVGCTSWYHTYEQGCTLGRYYSWSGVMDSSGIASGIPSECGQDNSCRVKNRIQGVCPAGWHLPDSSEFNDLVNYIHYVGKKYSSGEALRTRLFKSDVAGIYWYYDEPSVDAYGFGAIPIEYGYFDSVGTAKFECMNMFSNAKYEGYFAGTSVVFWSFWNDAETIPVHARLNGNSPSLVVDAGSPNWNVESLSKGIFTVRCIKD